MPGAEDFDAPAAYCLIHRLAAGDGSVETPGKSERGVVTDAEPHRCRCADAAVHERGSGAREQVVGAFLPRRAGVQDHELGSGFSLGQQARQAAGFHRVRAAVRADQREHALVAGGIEVAVPDEVQDVPGVIQQEVMNG